ncbi:helix-turn-helix domain-containing protein [Paracoccus sp. DMF-8]|uniref:GAF domain-containing protein n=1 Tax=Paracoccus sp. DMF-8 TaxID=3019445 RepID=UPI0023E84317|nr:GAF domain-containing protein [Paracoccus sp. DMF-8]MDF3606807.1 helix-turn-helix domain-containing protein [Paracoccus sp. DMF-8]
MPEARQETRHEDRVSSASQSPGAVTRLAASWRRSIVKHGLDPARAQARQRLSDAELALRRDEMGKFLSVAGPQLDQLFQLVCPTGRNVLLTDARGIVLEQRVSDGDAAAFQEWGLCRGVNWSEEIEGTNGIGTCLIEERQVVIHRDDHFYARNIGVSCIDAPIWGPDGRIIAALDVSNARSDGSEQWNALISAQVAQTARMIEAAFFRASFPDARIIVAQHPAAGESALLLAVDQDDLTIGANRAARRAFGLEKEGSLRPRPAGDILGRTDESPELARAERAALMGALARAEGNVSAAARALGIGRATMYRRMSRLGIDENPGRLSQS